MNQWGECMRLFIAINFNETTKQELLALSDELRGASSSGRFSLPENLHLTLVFLGECDGKQTTAAKSILDAIVFEPFDITIDCVGRFKRDGGDIWWAGVRENKILSDLQRTLTAGLCSNGFTCDKRKYSPHITLGREIITRANPRQIKPFGETVTNIDLMKSERIGGKLTYTSIYQREGALKV
jgi:2'-5' RNA ligase